MKKKSQEKSFNMSNYNKRTGILYILGAAFGFALMGLFVRMAGDLPTFEKVFFRNLIATFVAFMMLLRSNVNKKLTGKNFLILFLRSACGMAGIICNFYAIDHMNIADASILNKLSPFFAILASFIILKEKPAFIDIAATAIAFIGAVFVAKPSANFAFFVSLAGITGGLMAGCAYTLVRKLANNGVSGMFIVFFFSCFSTIAGIPLMMMNFILPSPIQLIMLLGAGFCAMIGQICITKAYTYAPAKEISVYDYTQVVYSAILGFVFMQQIPDILSITGYIIIISMAVVKWRYNNRK